MRNYIPKVERERGVDMEIDRFPAVRLQAWFDRLGGYSKDELKTKAEQAVREVA